MPRDGIVRAAADRQQIQRNHGKLRGRAALQEEDLMRIRHGERGTEARLRLGENVRVDGAAVTHLHDGHAGAAIVHQLRLRLFEHGFREHGRPRGEIENLISVQG